jgi:prepilin-type N-terminal cleavage/methylation domain-containing protein
MAAPRATGFTLIELLVVISIISILASIMLASLRAAQDRAEATVMALDFRNLERDLRIIGIDQGISEWWDEDVIRDDLQSKGFCPDIDLTDAIPFSCMAEDDAWLGTLYSVAPAPPFGTFYKYDNDTADDCDGPADQEWARGVNIMVFDVSTYQFDLVDQIIDGGDGDLAGRIRYGQNHIAYRLAECGALTM